MPIVKYCGAASVAVLALGMHGVAWSQAAPVKAPDPEPGVSTLDEVLVTARRREERLQEVPISIVAIGGEQLAERGVSRVEDLQSAVPGVRIEPQNSRTSTPQIILRGQRMYGLLAAQDPPTAFYFADALVLPIQGVNSALYDLSSVQVLKGPQGTLFGRNTTGGAVVIAPARPTDDWEGSMTVRGGNYATYGAEGYFNIPVNDTFRVRLSTYYNEHGGYDTYASPSLAGKKGYADRVFDTRLSLLWNPNDKFENYTVGYFSKLDSTGIPSTPVALNPNGPAARFNGTGSYASLPTISSRIWDGVRNPRLVYSDFPQSDVTKVYGLVNTTKVDISPGVSLKNILSYRNVTNQGYINIHGVDLPLLATWQASKTHSFSEEIQLLGDSFDGNLNWVTGLYYVEEGSLDEQSSIALYFPAAPANVTPFYTDANIRSYAAYGQATAKLDKFALTVGGRITKDERGETYMHRVFDRWGFVGISYVPRCAVVDDGGTPLGVNNCSLEVSTSFSQPTYNVSLDYHFTPDVMVYATQRTGYRAGGYNQRAFTAGQRLPFNPEKVLDREVGVKAEVNIQDWLVRLNLAYYNDRYKDLQKSVTQFTGSGSTTSIFNAAAATVEGVELDFEIKPVRELSVGGTYAYSKAKYSSFPYLLNSVVQDFSDRHFSGIPETQYNVYANYELPLPESMGTLSISADYSYQGSSYISDLYQSKQQIAVLYTPTQLALLPDSNRPYKLRAYNLVNARLQWADINGKPVSLAIYGKNLTNEVPEIGTNPGYEAIGVAMVNIGPPRTLGIELRYDF